tara:strand:- start:10 stop:222 length:213 start_codon:yes stop_codon:yes gene_type:complete
MGEAQSAGRWKMRRKAPEDGRWEMPYDRLRLALQEDASYGLNIEYSGLRGCGENAFFSLHTDKLSFQDPF